MPPATDDVAAAEETRRIRRQRKIVLGLGLTFVGLAALLLAPNLTGPLVADLPFLAVALVALYVGGILLGVGFGERRRGA
ncbi:MAG TPA: hypothetical protein VGP88_02335 [Thermoplasmata archaeon]|nr:hypothetical protein [Thermoplasmata archaeon]